jgi:hypothetical protein
VTPGPSADNVIAVWRSGTAAQRREGRGWYEAAHGAAASLDPGNVHRAAGVIAALSPRMPWARNLELAARAYADGRASGTLGMSCRAADAILAGAHPLDVLGGPKVRAFYTLIVDPADRVTVCVDRHAVDVAVGLRQTDTERDRWRLNRRGRYEVFADCYRAAGRVLRVRPGVLQAATWVIWRELWAPA